MPEYEFRDEDPTPYSLDECYDEVMGQVGLLYDEGCVRDLSDEDRHALDLRIAQAMLPEGWTLTPPQ